MASWKVEGARPVADYARRPSRGHATFRADRARSSRFPLKHRQEPADVHHRTTHEPYQGLPLDHHLREGDGDGAGRPRRHHPLCRRAGFRHPRTTSSSRRCAPSSKAGRNTRRSPASRSSARRSAGSSNGRTACATPRTRRCSYAAAQAGHLQRAHRDPRPGGRGHRPRPVLGELSGHGPARGRDPGGGRGRCRGRVPADAATARRGDHREDEVAALQQPMQPVGRVLPGGGRRRARRGAAPAPAGMGACRRHLRAHPLRRRTVLHDGAGRARSARTHPDDERILEGVLHDRLASRLRGGARRRSSRR